MLRLYFLRFDFNGRPAWKCQLRRALPGINSRSFQLLFFSASRFGLLCKACAWDGSRQTWMQLPRNPKGRIWILSLTACHSFLCLGRHFHHSNHITPNMCHWLYIDWVKAPMCPISWMQHGVPFLFNWPRMGKLNCVLVALNRIFSWEFSLKPRAKR